eukprot:scaffold430_cov49-Attheya_sp.AAC.1
MQYPTVIELTVLTAAGANAEAEAKRAREQTANFIVIALFVDVVRTTRWDKIVDGYGTSFYVRLLGSMMGLAYAGDQQVEAEDTSPGPPERLKEIPWIGILRHDVQLSRLHRLRVSTLKTRCTDVAHLFTVLSSSSLKWNERNSSAIMNIS